MCNTWGNCIRNFKRGEIATTILVLSLVAMGIGSILGLRNMNILKGSAQSACQYESTAYLWDESGNILTQITETAPFRLKTTFPNGEYTGGGEGERVLYGKLHKLVDLRDQDKDIMVQVQLTGIASNDDVLYAACTEFNNFPTQAGNPRKGACRDWQGDTVVLQLKCGSRNEYGWVLKNSAISRIISSYPSPTPFVCSGTNAWCRLPYTEKCGAGNSGSRTCYATQCSAQGGADKCQWGVGSCCSKCSDGSSDAATCPNGVAPVAPNATPTTAPTTAPTAVPTTPETSTGTIDSIQITYNNGATYTVSRNNNSCTSAVRTQGTCPSGDCRIDNGDASQPRQVRIFKKDGNFKVNKVMLYRGCPCNASGICDASKGGQAQQIRDDFCFGGNDSVDHINKMSCKFDGSQCNTTNDDSTPAPAGSCSGGTGGTNPAPTTPPQQPQQPQPTACPEGKIDSQGNCNPACCASNNDCSNGQSCTILNGFCGRGGGGKSCDPNSGNNAPTAAPQPTTPPQQPSNQCSGPGASCHKPYTEACDSGGHRTCYATECNGAGNLDKCVWGQGSYCDACVGGTNPQPTTPPQQPPNQCTGDGASCYKPYTEACQNGGTRTCYATVCNGIGNLDKCVWGPNSKCDACVGGTNPPSTPPGQPPSNGDTFINVTVTNDIPEEGNYPYRLRKLGVALYKNDQFVQDYLSNFKDISGFTVNIRVDDPNATYKIEPRVKAYRGNGGDDESHLIDSPDTLNQGVTCKKTDGTDSWLAGNICSFKGSEAGTVAYSIQPKTAEQQPTPQGNIPTPNQDQLRVRLTINPGIKTAHPEAKWIGYYLFDTTSNTSLGDHMVEINNNTVYDFVFTETDRVHKYRIEPRLKTQNSTGFDVDGIRVRLNVCSAPYQQAPFVDNCTLLAGHTAAFTLENNPAAPTNPPVSTPAQIPPPNSNQLSIRIALPSQVKTAHPDAQWIGYYLFDVTSNQSMDDHLQQIAADEDVYDFEYPKLDPTHEYRVEPRLKQQNATGFDIQGVKVRLNDCSSAHYNQPIYNNKCTLKPGHIASFTFENTQTSQPTVAPTPDTSLQQTNIRSRILIENPYEIWTYKKSGFNTDIIVKYRDLSVSSTTYSKFTISGFLENYTYIPFELNSIMNSQMPIVIGHKYSIEAQTNTPEGPFQSNAIEVIAAQPNSTYPLVILHYAGTVAKVTIKANTDFAIKPDYVRIYADFFPNREDGWGYWIKTEGSGTRYGREFILPVGYKYFISARATDRDGNLIGTNTMNANNDCESYNQTKNECLIIVKSNPDQNQYEFQLSTSSTTSNAGTPAVARSFKIQIIDTDVNGDGVVSVGDFISAIRSYGKTLSVNGTRMKVNAAYVSSILSNLGKKVR